MAKSKTKPVREYPDINDLKSPPPVEEIEEVNEVIEKDFNEKILEQVFDETNIKMKSEVTAKQIMPVSRMYVYASAYKCDAAKFIADTFLTLAVSKDRKGRSEFADIAKSAMSSFSEPELPPEEHGGVAKFIIGKGKGIR